MRTICIVGELSMSKLASALGRALEMFPEVKVGDFVCLDTGHPLPTADMHVLITEPTSTAPERFIRAMFPRKPTLEHFPICRLVLVGWIPLEGHSGGARPVARAQPWLRLLVDAFEPECVQLPKSACRVKTAITSILSAETRSEPVPVIVAGITHYLLDEIADHWSAFHHGKQSDAVNQGLGTFRALLTDLSVNPADAVTKAVQELSNYHESPTFREHLLAWLGSSEESRGSGSVISTLHSCAAVVEEWSLQVQGSVRAHTLGNIARLEQDTTAIVRALKSPGSTDSEELRECIDRLLAAISEARQRREPYE